jgi:hypothetical protein
MSVASEKPCGARDSTRFSSNVHGVDHAREGRQQHVEGVDGVEDRLLVLLEVAVVGQWQRLEGREQTGQVPDEAAGLAAREFGDVGVLLLRHDARPGRVGVVRVTKENSLVAHSTTSSAIREMSTATIAVTKANSAAKSREAVPSIEFSTDVEKPRSAATASGSSPSDEPANAPEP